MVLLQAFWGHHGTDALRTAQIALQLLGLPCDQDQTMLHVKHSHLLMRCRCVLPGV